MNRAENYSRHGRDILAVIVPLDRLTGYTRTPARLRAAGAAKLRS